MASGREWRRKASINQILYLFEDKALLHTACQLRLKRGVQDGSALRMNLSLAEMPKTGRRASLEKRKSQTLMGDVPSVRYLFQYQNIYVG